MILTLTPILTLTLKPGNPLGVLPKDVPLAVVMGSEGYGITKEMSDAADEAITLPPNLES